jgi:hypothetical protein
VKHTERARVRRRENRKDGMSEWEREREREWMFDNVFDACCWIRIDEEITTKRKSSDKQLLPLHWAERRACANLISSFILIFFFFSFFPHHFSCIWFLSLSLFLLFVIVLPNLAKVDSNANKNDEIIMLIISHVCCLFIHRNYLIPERNRLNLSKQTEINLIETKQWNISFEALSSANPTFQKFRITSHNSYEN